MGKFNTLKKPFESKKKKRNKKVCKAIAEELRGILNEKNTNVSWFNKNENIWNNEQEEGVHRRKIILPEEDLEFETDSETDDDNEELEETSSFKKTARNVIISLAILQNVITSSLVCSKCYRKIKLIEDRNHHQGLGTKLVLICTGEKCNMNSQFFTTPKFKATKSFKINLLFNIGMRAIGRGRCAALKLLSIMQLGYPVSKATWSQYTRILLEKCATIAEKNMTQAAKEVFDIKQKGDEKIVSAGVSLDCSWKSRGWHSREGVVAAISSDSGKILDCVHKTSYCRECTHMQEQRDEEAISVLQYMEWYLQHEPSCFLNHTGSPQVRRHD